MSDLSEAQVGPQSEAPGLPERTGGGSGRSVRKIGEAENSGGSGALLDLQTSLPPASVGHQHIPCREAMLSGALQHTRRFHTVAWRMIDFYKPPEQ